MDTTLTGDLRDALREGFRNVFGERLHRLILYGSYARGEATRGSDIDLLVVLNGEVGSDEQRRAREVGRDLFGAGGNVVSATVASRDAFATRNLPLYRNIRAEGTLLHPDDPAVECQLRAHTYPLNRAASGMHQESEAYLERARTRLDTAQAILDASQDATSAVSTAYYAMFFAATAALNEAGQAAKSHNGTITLFSETYVNDGPFDAHYGRALSDAQQMRIEADYAREPSITAEDAEQWLRRAEDFVGTVEAMLRNRADS